MFRTELSCISPRACGTDMSPSEPVFPVVLRCSCVEFRVPDSCVASGVKRLGSPSTEESRVETVGFDTSGKLVAKKLRPQLALAKAVTSF